MQEYVTFEKFLESNRFFKDPGGRIGVFVCADAQYVDIKLFGEKEEQSYQRKQLVEIKKDDKGIEEIITQVFSYGDW